MAVFVAVYSDKMLGVSDAEAIDIQADLWEIALAQAQRCLLELNSDSATNRFELQRLEIAR